MKSQRHLTRLTLCTILFATSSAHAGWYEIKNYQGSIGKAAVHISLQTFTEIDKNQPGQWHVDGSYYYDAHRTPIPLQGTRTADGKMQLCEASEPASFPEGPIVPKASPSKPVPCPINLQISDHSAAGEWNDGKNTLPITLRQIASLDDTSNDTPHIEGSVEIPMWHHSKTHLLLGIYQPSTDCPLSMTRLRLVNIKNGQIDKTLKFECGTGTVATSIYANVYRGQKPGHVTVIAEGGYHNMGDDQDVVIEP